MEDSESSDLGSISHQHGMSGILMKLPGTGDDLFATSSKLPDRHAIRSGGLKHLAFLETTAGGVLRDAKILR